MKHLHLGRTANAALAASIMASATPMPFIHGRALSHESITAISDEHIDPRFFHEELTGYLAGAIRTANASLFTQAHFSEPATHIATGWRDTANLDALCDFIAPTVPGLGERYEHIIYPNAEAFLSDVNGDDDLRAINGDFKTIDDTQGKRTGTIPNRGLRMVVDYDKVKNEPNWQETRISRIMQRLKRNAARRKYALLVASGTDVPLVWDAAGAADPDYDLANQAALSGDASGITPTSALWGVGSQLLRFQTYGATNAAKATAGRAMSPAQAAALAGLNAMVDQSRYQAGTAKSRIVGSKVALFTSAPTSTMDPSNLKTAKANTQSGGLYAVYVRQLTVKQWEIVVECYETEWCATTLGIRILSITAS
jgi:hypothetical protein